MYEMNKQGKGEMKNDRFSTTNKSSKCKKRSGHLQQKKVRKAIPDSSP